MEDGCDRDVIGRRLRRLVRMRRLKVAADSRDPVNLKSSEPLSDDADFEDALAKLRDRAEGIYAWLEDNHSSDMNRHAHLQEGSVERAYWHSGYAVAMMDAIRLITGQKV